MIASKVLENKMLCEDHSSVNDRVLNSQLIDQLYDEGDIVLVENIILGPPDQNQDGPVSYMTRHTQVCGWDSQKGRWPIYEFSKEINETLNLVKKLTQEHNLSNEKWHIRAQEVVDGIPKNWQTHALKNLSRSL